MLTLIHRLFVLVAGASCLQPNAGRRAAIGGAALAALSSSLPPQPVLANTEGAAKVASGYVEVPREEIMKAQVSSYMDGLELAMVQKNWAKVAEYYAPDAAVVDGVSSPTVYVKGGEMNGHLGTTLSGGISSLRVAQITLEGEFAELPKFAHVLYTLAPSGGAKPYRGILRLKKTTSRLTVEPDWKIDENVYPLDAAKIYAMVTPQRSGPNVYMALDSKIKKSKF